METRNPTAIIDQSKIRPFHILFIFWLFLIILFDGYDVVVYGAVVPSLIEEWGITDLLAGSIGSYTVIGMAIGTILCGILADKFGRKKVIIGTTLLFSLFTILSGFAPNEYVFIVFRVIAGLGLGGVMPNVIALTTEYAPRRIRAALISFVFCGYSLGAIIAALTSRAVLPEFGWQPVFWLAGIPILFLPFLLKHIPESIVFLLLKDREQEAKQILQKLAPDEDLSNVKLEKPVLPKSGSPVVHLFKEKRSFSTLMFWTSCFCAFVLIYALNTWLPTLMMQAGNDLSSSLLFTAVLQLGAIVGTLIFGRVVDKVGFKKVMVPLFFTGAVALSFVGMTTNAVIVFALLAIIGASSLGVQNLSNAFVSQYYPSTMRSTALGSTIAFGRIGGIVAPTFVGILLTMNLQPQFNFMALGIAALIGGTAMIFVQEQYAAYTKDTSNQSVEKSA